MLRPPARRVAPAAQLPQVQHVTRTIAADLQAQLLGEDAMRLAKTSAGQSRKLIGPLPSPQQFVELHTTNNPNSLAEGIRKRNAKRQVNKTRGRGAGV